MDDIKNAIVQASEKVLSSDLIQRTIEEQITQTVKQAVEAHFASYSDFGKEVAQKIKDQMRVNLDQITFAEYNQAVLELVQGTVNHAITDGAKNKFAADLNELLGTPPKTINLSQLISSYMDDHRRDAESERVERIGLLIQDNRYSPGRISVGLNRTNKRTGYFQSDDKPLEETYQCELDIALSPVTDGEPGTYKIDSVMQGNAMVLKQIDFMPTCHYQTAKRLYQIYCAGSHIVLDHGKDVANYSTDYFHH